MIKVKFNMKLVFLKCYVTRKQPQLKLIDPGQSLLTFYYIRNYYSLSFQKEFDEEIQQFTTKTRDPRTVLCKTLFFRNNTRIFLLEKKRKN